MTVLNVLHLLCRLLLALSFLVFALDGILISSLARQHGTGGLHEVEWAAVFVLSALLLFIVTWLLFGLRSRVVATIGLAIFAGQLFWFHSLGLDTSYGIAHLALSAVLALPLIVLGGGRFAIYRRGWQVPI